MTITKQQAYLILNMMHVSIFNERIPVIISDDIEEGIEFTINFLNQIKESFPEVTTHYSRLYEIIDE